MELDLIRRLSISADSKVVLCVLDGVPVANHPRLAGRIIVTDPDDLEADTSVDTELRRHGTAMASICAGE